MARGTCNFRSVHSLPLPLPLPLATNLTQDLTSSLPCAARCCFRHRAPPPSAAWCRFCHRAPLFPAAGCLASPPPRLLTLPSILHVSWIALFSAAKCGPPESATLGVCPKCVASCTRAVAPEHFAARSADSKYASRSSRLSYGCERQLKRSTPDCARPSRSSGAGGGVASVRRQLVSCRWAGGRRMPVAVASQ
eukprot:95046-Chlamydomonas_euryale.AAC.1